MSTSEGTAKLSKKQQKALKHRTGVKKGKERAPDESQIQQDIPEQEHLEDEEESQPTATKVKKQQQLTKKKSKAADDGLPYSGIDDPAANSPKKTKKRKRDTGEEDGIENGGQAGKDKPKTKRTKDSKQRFIVFVGNLPYKVTTEDIVKHFEEECGEKPSVRLLTPKVNAATAKNPNLAAKSKGCAFVEFTTSSAVQAALHLHQSTFISSSSSAKRKINVELTAGGGGNSENRKKKIGEIKDRLEKQREKHKTEADKAKEVREEDLKKERAETMKKQAEEAKKAASKKAKRWASGANSVRIG